MLLTLKWQDQSLVCPTLDFTLREELYAHNFLVLFSFTLINLEEKHTYFEQERERSEKKFEHSSFSLISLGQTLALSSIENDLYFNQNINWKHRSGQP